MKFRSILTAATLMAATIAVPALAGTIIVAGDTTISTRFVTAVNSGNAALAGNIAFQRNILEGGTTIATNRYSINDMSLPTWGQQVTTAYNSLGYTASFFEGTVNASTVAGVDLLILFGPSNAFTAAETDVIRNFLYGGGNVLVTGESANNGSITNNHINALLTSLGSTIRLNQVTEGIGDQFATGTEILSDPLTAGVASFGYGRTTTVTGGRTLFLNDSNNPFIAAQDIAAPVPEPATWLMLIGGFGMIGGTLRRRNISARAYFA